ncbi:hypothetical protein NDU88_005689 [Pleurodeles waltl]|uniref:Uncharacterized protein n=1 Tax=Pleurodeles waltl TaxID=8319 RepID=A0AAV7L4R4_PLEWA|nr:hypothetical protein NDU88_005689 [Pleurodeles waltl]
MGEVAGRRQGGGKRQPHVVSAEEGRPYVVSAEERRPHVVSAEERRPHVVSAEERRPHVVSAEEREPHVVSAEERQPHVVSAEERQPHVVSAEEILGPPGDTQRVGGIEVVHQSRTGTGLQAQLSFPSPIDFSAQDPPKSQQHVCFLPVRPVSWSNTDDAKSRSSVSTRPQGPAHRINVYELERRIRLALSFLSLLKFTKVAPAKWEVKKEN